MNKISSIILIIFSLSLLFFSLTGKHGLIQLQKINYEIKKITEKNTEISDNISRIKNKIYGIQNSNAVIEKTAREELGLARSNEVVYVFPDKEDPANKDNEKQKK